MFIGSWEVLIGIGLLSGQTGSALWQLLIGLFLLQAGHGRLLVFEGQTFRGLLTHTGVTRLLQIKMALRM